MVGGALLNDALGSMLPDWANELLGAWGDSVGTSDDEFLARQVSRGTDDLLGLITDVFVGLGGDDGSDAPSGGGAAGGCELTTSDGACVDHAGGGSGVFGDPHLRTFDGLPYDLMAVGEFLLVGAPAADVDVQVRFVPHPVAARLSITEAVAVRAGEAVATVERRGGDDVEMVLAGVTVEPDGTTESGRIRVRRGGTLVAIEVADGPLVAVRIWPSRVDVFVDPSRLEVHGLLGDANGDPADDLRVGLADGAEVLDPAAVTFTVLHGPFADAWRLTDATSVLPRRAGESAATFADPGFPGAPVDLEELPAGARSAALALCRSVGVLDGADLRACVLDVAATGDDSFADGAALASAARPEPGWASDRFLTSGRLRPTYPVPTGGWASEVVAYGAGELSAFADRDPTVVLGPRDTRSVPLGEADAVCELPLVLGFDVPVRDRPGPDLGVAQLGGGDLTYDVWIGMADGNWRFVGRGVTSAVFDLAGVLGPDEEAVLVRLCDPPAEVDGAVADRAVVGQGASIAAVAVLDLSAGVVGGR